MSPATPIKKYNYERSAYRWFMARHFKKFEDMGMTTRKLERAPLARQAFYESSWEGARKLIRCVDCRYERTQFFDHIIERGLQSGTRFNIIHLRPDEKDQLGIASQPGAPNKHYLRQFGPDPKNMAKQRRQNVNVHCEAHKMLWSAIHELLGEEALNDLPHCKIVLKKLAKTTKRSNVTQLVIDITHPADDDDIESGEQQAQCQDDLPCKQPPRKRCKTSSKQKAYLPDVPLPVAEIKPDPVEADLCMDFEFPPDDDMHHFVPPSHTSSDHHSIPYMEACPLPNQYGGHHEFPQPPLKEDAFWWKEQDQELDPALFHGMDFDILESLL